MRALAGTRPRPNFAGFEDEIAGERAVRLAEVEIDVAEGKFHGLNALGMRGAGVPTKKIQRSRIWPSESSRRTRARRNHAVELRS